MDRTALVVLILLAAFACIWGPRVALAASPGGGFDRPASYTYEQTSTGWKRTVSPSGQGSPVQNAKAASGAGGTAGMYRAGSYAGSAGAYSQSGVWGHPASMRVPATVSYPVSASALATAVARVAAKYSPYALAGLALYDYLSDSGITECSGSWCRTLPGQSSDYAAGSPYNRFATYAAAKSSVCAGFDICDVFGQTTGTTFPDHYFELICYPATKGSQTACISNTSYSQWSYDLNHPRKAYYWDGYSGYSCPGAVNGVCHWPSSEAPIEGSLADRVNTMQPLLADGAADRFADVGPEVVELGESPDLGDPVVSGPASTPGGTQTATHPDGSQTVTETKFHHTYDGPTITTTETTTITEIDASQTVTSTTTITNTAPPADQSGSSGPELCDLYPDVLACWTAGEVSEPDALPESTVELDFEPVTVPGSSSSCPAPIQFTVQGHSFELPWTHVCQFASAIKPIMLILAWIAAARIVIGAVRGV